MMKRGIIISLDGIFKMKFSFSFLVCCLFAGLFCSCCSMRNLNSTTSNNAAKDTVMYPGMTISINNPECISLSVEAGDDLVRNFSWNGSTRSVKLLPRLTKWYGAYGAYTTGKENLGEHEGIIRIIAREAILNFESYEHLLCALSPKSNDCRKKYYKYKRTGGDLDIANFDFQNTLLSDLESGACSCHTSDGLYVSVKTAEGPGEYNTLYVDVFKILVNGKQVANLPNSSSDRISVQTKM